MKVSTKMKKGIKVCEEILGVKYTGKSFDEAKEFLDKNLPKIKGKDIRDYRAPSEKMYKAIDFIEKTLEVEFTGKTMQEASEFISSWLQKAKDAKK